MRIGIDFDNTIACYDGVFHLAALDRRLIPPGTPSDKTSVRDYLRERGLDSEFTKLQGYVYGARMDLVSLYPGVLNVLRNAARMGHELYIVSHKTKTPYAGAPYDLHAAARVFLAERRIVGDAGLLRDDDVFFELTQTEKTERIAQLNCDVFIDDLPEFLALEGFPNAMRRILFDPHGHHDAAVEDRPLERFTTWAGIGRALLD